MYPKIDGGMGKSETLLQFPIVAADCMLVSGMVGDSVHKSIAP